MARPERFMRRYANIVIFRQTLTTAWQRLSNLMVKIYFSTFVGSNGIDGPGRFSIFQHHYKNHINMKALKERILKDGKCFEGGILKVDNFINHQMDPILMKSMAVEFVRRFAGSDINKILTIEASGIAPAIMVGYLLELPVVFAKKKKPSTMENMLSTTVYSFTKNRSYDVCVCGDYLHKGDKILFIDDFLANGNAAKGIIDLVRQAGAEIAGMGFLIEKEFQHGRDELVAAGIRVESLAIIESLDDCKIKIR